MKKIIIVGFYDLKEHMSHIKDSFTEYLYEVHEYPLFRYAYDSNDKIDEYEKHFDKFIKSVKPDIILWWFNDVVPQVFKYIKSNNKDVYFILYNGDDPLNFNTDMIEKSKIFDMIVTPCNHNVTKYKQHAGVSNVQFMLPGYNEEYFYPTEETDEDYICDISMMCDNLFKPEFFGKQYISREVLIRNVSRWAENNNRKFHLYGPFTLKELFPRNYKGDIEYYNQNKLFNCSKINISTHPVFNKDLPMNHLDMKIAGSGGFLFMDKIKDSKNMFVHNMNCYIFDNENYVDELDSILNNYENYSHIKKNIYKFAEQFKWRDWVKKIHIQISKHFFDSKNYADMYNLDISSDELWDHWLHEGVDKKEICYNFKVPNNFNFTEYADLFNVDKKNTKAVYLHWYINSKNYDFMNRDKSNNGGSLDAETLDISQEQLYEVYSILNKVKEYSSTDNGLERLSEICKCNPNFKLNEAVENYLSMCEQK